MPDLSEFYDARRKTSCVVGDAIHKLTPDDAEKFIAALGTSDILTTSITRFLHARGYKINHSTVARHRKGECCCD